MMSQTTPTLRVSQVKHAKRTLSVHTKWAQKLHSTVGLAGRACLVAITAHTGHTWTRADTWTCGRSRLRVRSEGQVHTEHERLRSARGDLSAGTGVPT